MTEEVTLVDRGRGLQLSNNRITVADLVPYFRRGRSYEVIMWAMPSLTPKEIALVEAYYREHKEELDERDRQIDELWEQRRQEQHKRFPGFEGTDEERKAYLRKRLRERLAGKNGDQTAGGQ